MIESCSNAVTTVLWTMLGIGSLMGSVLAAWVWVVYHKLHKAQEQVESARRLGMVLMSEKRAQAAELAEFKDVVAQSQAEQTKAYDIRKKCEERMRQQNGEMDVMRARQDVLSAENLLYKTYYDKVQK